MSNFITLMGAEAVERAGHKMQQAASDMERAVSQLSSTLERHHRFMDDWLMRFESALEKVNAQGGT